MFPLSLLSIFTKMCNISPQLPITPLHLGLTNSVVWLPIHSIISKPYSHTQELCQIYCFTVDPVRTQVPKVAYYMESRKLLVAASLQPCSPLSWKATLSLTPLQGLSTGLLGSWSFVSYHNESAVR